MSTLSVTNVKNESSTSNNLVLDSSANTTVGGNLIAQAGSAATPSIQATGDTNTGIYFSAADTVDIATGGTQRVQFDSSGNLRFNSGYGSVATAYGVRAWCNADLTGSGSIRGSGNVSSLGDQATGRWQFNFATSMPDTNYAAVGMQKPNADIVNMTGLHPTSPSFDTYTTALVAFIYANASGGLVDPLIGNLVVLR